MNDRDFIKKLNEILWFTLDFDREFDIRELLKKYLDFNKQSNDKSDILK